MPSLRSTEHHKGALFIRNNVDDDDNNNIILQAKSGEYSIICDDDGAVTLYHDNAAKLATESGGVTVTGNTQSTSFTAGTANPNAELLYLLGSGHTGHGASNTVSLASIAENTSGNTMGLWIGSMTNENTGVIGSRTASGNIAFQTYSGGWGERMRIKHDGKVGIGKTPSTWFLDVDSSDGYIASFDGSNNTGIAINSSSGIGHIIGYSNSGSSYNKINIRGASGTG